MVIHSNNFDLKREYSEKRDYMRMPLEMPIKFSISGDPKPYTGTCKNISGNGILFESHIAIAKDTKLEVAINGSNRKFSNFKAIVNVIRTDSKFKSSLIAAKIIDILN